MPYRFKLYAAAFLAAFSAILGLVPIVCVGELFRAYLVSNLTKGIVVNLAVISAGAIALRYFFISKRHEAISYRGLWASLRFTHEALRASGQFAAWFFCDEKIWRAKKADGRRRRNNRDFYRALFFSLDRKSVV